MVDHLRRNAFPVFWYTLGVVILYQSVMTLVQFGSQINSDHHAILISLLAGVEVVGVIGFLRAATLVRAGYLLLTVFALAFLFHLMAGQFESILLIYAAGVWLVMVEKRTPMH